MMMNKRRRYPINNHVIVINGLNRIDNRRKTIPMSQNVHTKKRSWNNSISEEEIDFNVAGIKNALDQRLTKRMRIFWSFVVLVCAGLTVYQIVDRIMYYYSYPVQVYVEVLQENSRELPNITVCPGILYSLMKQFPFRKVSQAELEKQSLNFIASALKLNENSSMTEVWNKIRVNPSVFEFQSRCDNSFTSALRTSDNQCKWEYQTKDVSTIFGMCTTFFINERILYHGFGTNLILKITSSIEVERDFTFLVLNTPKRPCNDEVFVSKCLDDCINLQMSSEISCRLPFIQNIDLPECPPEKLLEALQVTMNGYFIVDIGKCNCPRLCLDGMFLTASPTARNFLDDVRLVILFNDNFKEFIYERYSYNFSLLLSDIGGNLGLFLGCCVVSILEILFAGWSKIHQFFKQ